MSEVREKLLPVFLEEAQENLKAIKEGLVNLCSGEGRHEEILNAAFRAVHTTKGTAALVRLEGVRLLGSALEEALESLVHAKTQPDQAQCQLLQRAAEALDDLVNTVHAGRPEASSSVAHTIDSLTRQLKNMASAIHQEGKEFPQTHPADDQARLLEEMTSLYERSEKTSAEQQPAFSCCRFSIGRKEYYLDMKYMTEICELPDIVPLPLSPHYIAGLANLRGTVVPIINLAILDNDASLRDGAEMRLVVAEDRGEHLGFLAEGMPQLATKKSGQEVDVVAFVRQFQVKSN